jgi:hypothetical protein
MSLCPYGNLSFLNLMIVLQGISFMIPPMISLSNSNAQKRLFTAKFKLQIKDGFYKK